MASSQTSTQGDQVTFQLSEQHDVMVASMGKAVLAPVDLDRSGLQILDSGTADGYWLRDLMSSMADPQRATFIGTDITDARFPKTDNDNTPNLQLTIQSITEPWPEDWAGRFDLVHQRLTLAGCRKFPVETAVANICRLVKPGGWIQLVEPEQVAVPEDGPVMKSFMGMIGEVLTSTGMPVSYAPSLKTLLESNKLQNVHEQRYDMLLGARNPDPVLAAKGVRSTVIAVGMFVNLARTLPPALKPNIPDDKLASIVTDLEEELKARGGNYPFRVVWGQRPL